MCPVQNVGAFVSTTDVYDVSHIYAMDVKSKEFKDFLVRLRQSINNIALSLNIRDAGYYDQTEFVCGQLWFPDPTLTSQTEKTPTYRQVYRKVINFGALPNTATKTVAHNVTFDANSSFTRTYGSASDPAAIEYKPIPYAHSTANYSISLDVDTINVSIQTWRNWSAFTICYVVIEYIKE
jgi:hypothetical protein